jgi:hypothetical protein
MLVPQEALGGVLLLFLVSGGICFIVGARKAGTGLIATAIAVPLVTVLVEAVFNEAFAVLPPRLAQIAAWIVLIIVYVAIFGALMSFLFGQKAWDGAKGNLLAGAIKGILRIAVSWPFLLVWSVLGVYLWLK